MAEYHLIRPDIGRFVAIGALDFSLYPAGTREMTPSEIAAWEAELAEHVPAPPAPSAVLCCLANLSFDAGAVGGVETAVGFSMAFQISPDVVWAFFNEPMENTSYGWNIGATSGDAKVTARQLDYIEVTTTGATEPYTLSIQVYKVQL